MYYCLLIAVYLSAGRTVRADQRVVEEVAEERAPLASAVRRVAVDSKANMLVAEEVAPAPEAMALLDLGFDTHAVDYEMFAKPCGDVGHFAEGKVIFVDMSKRTIKAKVPFHAEGTLVKLVHRATGDVMFEHCIRAAGTNRVPLASDFDDLLEMNVVVVAEEYALQFTLAVRWVKISLVAQGHHDIVKAMDAKDMLEAGDADGVAAFFLWLDSYPESVHDREYLASAVCSVGDAMGNEGAILMAGPELQLLCQLFGTDAHGRTRFDAVTIEAASVCKESNRADTHLQEAALSCATRAMLEADTLLAARTKLLQGCSRDAMVLKDGPAKVFVAGAGPAGLLTAMKMSIRGARVSMVEMRRHFIRSQAILAANTLDMFKQFGLEHTAEYKYVEENSGDEKFASYVDLESWGGISIANVQRVMARGARFYGVEVNFGGKYLAHCPPSGDQPMWTALVRNSNEGDIDDTRAAFSWATRGGDARPATGDAACNGEGERVPFDLLVGAEGVRSLAREQAGIKWISYYEQGEDGWPPLKDDGWPVEPTRAFTVSADKCPKVEFGMDAPHAWIGEFFAGYVTPQLKHSERNSYCQVTGVLFEPTPYHHYDRHAGLHKFYVDEMKSGVLVSARGPPCIGTFDWELAGGETSYKQLAGHKHGAAVLLVGDSLMAPFLPLSAWKHHIGWLNDLFRAMDRDVLRHGRDFDSLWGGSAETWGERSMAQVREFMGRSNALWRDMYHDKAPGRRAAVGFPMGSLTATRDADEMTVTVTPTGEDLDQDGVDQFTQMLYDCTTGRQTSTGMTAVDELKPWAESATWTIELPASYIGKCVIIVRQVHLDDGLPTPTLDKKSGLERRVATLGK